MVVRYTNAYIVVLSSYNEITRYYFRIDLTGKF